MQKIEFQPIGTIHSPYTKRSMAPFQGNTSNELFELEIFDAFTDGLKDIEGFSHIIVIYFAHKSTHYTLQVITPWDTAPHGVFATCSPNRPNSILISVSPLLRKIGNSKLVVTHLDALDGTPILDIKPYLPDLMCHPSAKLGWMKEKTPFTKK